MKGGFVCLDTYWGRVSTGKGSRGRKNDELVHLGKKYLSLEQPKLKECKRVE